MTDSFANPVETYRKADWIDVSLGLMNFELPRGFVRSVKPPFRPEAFTGVSLNWQGCA
jgi:hypothetical protein